MWCRAVVFDCAEGLFSAASRTSRLYLDGSACTGTRVTTLECATLVFAHSTPDACILTGLEPQDRHSAVTGQRLQTTLASAI